MATGSRLVPNEEMAVGGLYTVRGYPESITAGDTVINGTIEYRYHLAKTTFDTAVEESRAVDAVMMAAQDRMFDEKDKLWDLVGELAGEK